ncbi:hypothetical protein [Saccharothrix sp. 6-C]|uniref:hypothetical protein n=1 Tax=Saccharothrix sp. 6-C TaxID=2781735 RepID=UPI001F39991E|nr:hypothetical protein [Saccharothrix sp. 6-C]
MVGGVRVDRTAPDRSRGAVRAERADEPGLRVLPAAQPVDLGLGGQLVGHAAEQQVGDLDRVALGADGRRRPRPVGEQAEVGVPAALQHAGGLGAGGLGERGEPADEVVPRGASAGTTVTPSRTTTCDPIQTSSPTVMPIERRGCRNTSVSGSSTVWLNARIEVCAPIRTASPNRMSPRTTAYGLIEQSRPARGDPLR